MSSLCQTPFHAWATAFAQTAMYRCGSRCSNWAAADAEIQRWSSFHRRLIRRKLLDAMAYRGTLYTSTAGQIMDIVLLLSAVAAFCCFCGTPLSCSVFFVIPVTPQVLRDRAAARETNLLSEFQSCCTAERIVGNNGSTAV